MVKRKIVCTIGPASDSEAVLRNMMFAGMDVARLNFSHGTHTDHQRRIDLIRTLNKKYRRHVRILQDLEGYRIRIGRFRKKKAIELKKKQSLLLTNRGDAPGDGTVITFDYNGPLKDIRIGSLIYIDDGNIVLEVKGRTGDSLRTEVIIPGLLRERKGVNIPDCKLRFTGLTEKDRADLRFGIENRVDYVAQSFVRDKDDIIHIRDLVKNELSSCKLIAKIEKP